MTDTSGFEVVELITAEGAFMKNPSQQPLPDPEDRGTNLKNPSPVAQKQQSERADQSGHAKSYKEL